MKQKKMVELVGGQELDEETYDELYTHGRNSGIWYANNLPKTTHEFRRKLYEKGYPKEPVVVVSHSGREEINIVDAIVDSLVESLWMDDERYAERYAERKKNAKYGRARVARELRNKGIQEDIIENALDLAFTEEADEELKAYVRSQYERESRSVTDPWKLKQKIVRRAVGRGYPMDQVFLILEELMDD